jgi:hypothetical protein
MDRSLAQGAVVSPSYVLSTEVLGIKPAAAGFKQIRIEPKPGGLEWAKGTFPSVRGPVSVDWKSSATEFRIQVALPAETSGELVLPVTPARLGKVTQNGVILPLTRIREAEGRAILPLSAPRSTTVAAIK